jgi:hypothetical protein
MSLPYTYLLTHKISGQRYYGARYAKGCHPNDLWTTYFSSSKRVSWLIEKYGKDSFDYEIRRTFTDVDSCREWECKFLQRVNAKQSKEWLNMSNGKAAPYVRGKAHPSYGKKNPHTPTMLGKKHKEITKQKIASSLRGVAHDPIRVAKMRATKAKHYIVTTPSGEEIYVTNLMDYAKDNNITHSSLYRQCKGYRVCPAQ